MYRATYTIDKKEYAIKVVRLHIKKSDKIVDEIYRNRVYRELSATCNI